MLAGATDFYPSGGATRDEDVLDITGIVGLRQIAWRGDHWFVPCGTTWTDVIAAPLPPLFDGLKQAAAQVGGVQVQNAGTVVGNLCNASPAADGVPCLLAMGAEVELASLAGVRVVEVGKFVLGPRRTGRRANELVTGLRVRAVDSSRTAFVKLGARRYLVISIAMVAVAVEVAGGLVTAARVAVGACGPMATRLPDLEAAMLGNAVDPRVVQAVHLAGLTPIDDIRGDADYRRVAALELVRRAIGAVG